MTNDPDQIQYLEVYKLHAELADRVSQRREGANRLYVSLLAGLMVFLAAWLRFGLGDTSDRIVLVIVGLFGVFLAGSWFSVIRSYKQLNSEKFRVLHELEQHLAFQFFIREWDPQSKGKKSDRYWKLTNVESALPFLFGALFTGLVVYALCCRD